MRTYKTLIQEAEALAMSPEAAYDFLKQRSKQSEGESRNDPFDNHAEETLMTRADPLIDLALAQYCRHSSTAAALFEKAAPGSAVRLAVLTNRAMQTEIFHRFPAGLFKNTTLAASWLSQASLEETRALFENPTLDDSFLREVLKRTRPWDALDDNMLCNVVAILQNNERMCTPRKDEYMDGGAEYSYSAVFDAAWCLAESVQPTEDWSYALGWLYNNMETDAFSIKDPLALVPRWSLDPTDVAAAEKEKKDNDGGWLSSRQRVRKGLGRLALSKKSALLAALLSSDDVALRMAAVATGQVTVDQLNTAFARDGKLLYNEARYNPWLWRTAPLRKSLKDIAWAVVREDKNSDLLPANIYNSICENHRAKHPEWFKDEEYDDIEENPAAVPAKKADIDLLAQLVEQTRLALQALSNRTDWIWWFSLGALVANVRYFK